LNDAANQSIGYRLKFTEK